MNKNKKIAPKTFWQTATALYQSIVVGLSRLTIVPFATAVLLSLLTFKQTNGQGNFQAQYEAPTTITAGFPAHPKFDPNVMPAETLLRSQAGNDLQHASHEESPEAILGSAGQMFSSVSSSLKTKWEEGELKDQFGSYFQNFDAARMIGSLALVLGGYFGLVWVSRYFGGGNGRVPKEVVEVLGQTPFGPKKHLQIVRLGSKLLLLMNSPEGTHPIGEITDPREVEHLASLCQGRKTTNAASIMRIANAATNSATSPVAASPATGAALTNATATAAAAIAAAAPMVAAANPALAASPNHLAAILQTLNGQSGNAAVFEA